MTMLSHDWRVSLYRIIWESGEGSVHAFALESTRDSARRFFGAAIALIAGMPADDLELYNLYSYRDLVNDAKTSVGVIGFYRRHRFPSPSARSFFLPQRAFPSCGACPVPYLLAPDDRRAVPAHAAFRPCVAPGAPPATGLRS